MNKDTWYLNAIYGNYHNNAVGPYMYGWQYSTPNNYGLSGSSGYTGVGGRRQDIIPRNEDFNPAYSTTINDVAALGSDFSFEPDLSLASSTITKYLDLFRAPDYYKNIGAFGQSIIDSSSKVMYRLDKVDDFESCGQYYHRNGYLVNEYVNEVTDIFKYINTRHFYNVLKLSSADIHMKSTIESASLIAQIKARLYNGLRLWNYDAVINGNEKITIGDFTFDNVEKDYITN